MSVSLTGEVGGGGRSRLQMLGCCSWPEAPLPTPELLSWCRRPACQRPSAGGWQSEQLARPSRTRGILGATWPSS